MRVRSEAVPLRRSARRGGIPVGKTKDLGITYGGEIRVPMGLASAPPGFVESSGLYVAHDSSWGTHPNPLGGYVIIYCNGARCRGTGPRS